MASNQPNDPMAQVQAQLQQLQNELATVHTTNDALATQLNTLQNAGIAAPAAPQAPTFALTPATSNLTGLLNYLSKLGGKIYKEGCKKLTDDKGFAMTPATMAVFVKIFANRCSVMGWNQGAQGITILQNSAGIDINIVKAYGQINEATLKTCCDVFCRAGEANYQSPAAQNNHMMAQCLKNSLTSATLAHLEPYQAQYTFDGIEYAPLMYKIIMRLATINSIATTETLRKNLDSLPIFATSVNSDVDMINSYFDANYSQILARSALVDNLLSKLFDGYLAIPDDTFRKYILSKQERYHNGKLGALYTHESLMAQASAKFTFLKVRDVWGAKSPEEERLVALIAKLKGKLKLVPELAKKKKDFGKRDMKKPGNARVKNKKNTTNKKTQKQEDTWKKTPPKDGDYKEKNHKGKTYHWCEHHMAWGIHSPKDCRLGTSRKEGDQASKKEYKPNSVAAAATAATIACPSITSLISKFMLEDD
jgi:hypothetical protein